MSAYTAHRPVLRDDCSYQLQHAWQDGQWTNVINMAKGKAKSTKDSYFEALEIAARSQLDSPIDRQAAWQAVEKLIDDKTVLKDPAAVDLYEWALVSTGMNCDQYPKYIGVMRVNLVKANPKLKEVAKTSFFSCISNEDWEHAQQIAAMMDKNFPAEPSFHFRNITTMYLYARSLDDTDGKKSMFRTLALRQIEKAKASRHQDSSTAPSPSRAISTQDEMLLWLEMTVKDKKGQELINCLADAKYNALDALKDGFETVCCTMMDQLRNLEAWDEFYTICKDIFENGVAFALVEEREAEERAAREAQPKQEKSLEQKAAELMAAMDRLNITSTQELSKAKLAAESNATLTMIKDWKVWESFIIAASKQPNAKKALKEVEGYFMQVIDHVAKHAIYRTQLDMARLMILFNTPRESDSDESLASGARIDGLMAYIHSHYRDANCFDNLMRFFDVISISEAKLLLERLDTNDSQSEESQFQNIMLLTFRLRLRYFFATSPKCYAKPPTGDKTICGLCNSESSPGECLACFKEIAKACIWTWKTGFKNENLQKQIESEGTSPNIDLTIIGSVCLLKIAGLDGLWGRNGISPLEFADPKLILQAVIWMDVQHQLQPFKRQDLSVLLVKMYLLIGAASHAQIIWDHLEVKNVTLNCLGPLFTDRLATMAPGLWATSHGTPTSKYLNYYRNAVNKSIPNSLRLSFDNGSYLSVIGNISTKTKTKQSCTLVMALADHYRGIRSVEGNVLQETWTDQLAQHIKPGMPLYDTTDYGPFPNIEGNPHRPIQDFLGIGPGLSEDRAHLSLLSERFLSLVAYKEPKDHKPTNVALAKDHDQKTVVSSCQNVAEWMNKFMNGNGIRDKLTLPEVEYYSLVQGLASYVALSLTAPKGDGRDKIVELIRSRLIEQTFRLMNRRLTDQEAKAQDASTTRIDVFHDLTALHANGMLRESALVTIQVVRYLERTRGSDTKEPMPKWMGDHLKILKSCSAVANRRLKEYIERLNSTVTTTGWIDRISEWAFGDLVNGTRTVSDDAGETLENSDIDMLLYKAVGRGPDLENTVGQILDSWQDAARGWSKVKIID